MSAIYGVLRLDGTDVAAREIERMGAVLAHRGPDGRHVATNGRVGMGHALMRVCHEDWHEAQPIVDGGVMLAADLRLDNRERVAVAAGIDPAALPEWSDSALLLAAYRLWGEACVDHIVGDFSFAIWDAARRTLLLARDAMGQRGLYYHQGDGFVAFASEARALWAIDGVPRRLSDDAIARRLSPPGDPVPGQCLFEGIATLPGGTMLRIDATGAAHPRRYWQPHADPAHLDRDDAYYLRAYREVLGEAVGCRVRRLLRRPALLFSGGFDSGAIAVLAGPIVQQQGRTIFCVSSVLPEGETRPGVADARAAVLSYEGLPFLDIHYHLRRPEEPDRLDEQFAATMDPNIVIQRQLLAVAATSGARLVLNGYGGDYTVHPRARGMLGRFLRHGAWRRFARETAARRRATRQSWARILYADILPAFQPMRLPAWIKFLRAGERPWRPFQPIAPALAAAHRAAQARGPRVLRDAGVHLVDRWRARWIEIQWRMMLGEPSTHTAGAACGLDQTRPFHDPRVIELGLAIPERLQMRHGLERHVPRAALADLLPAAVRAVGPGNNQMDPDQYAHVMTALPAVLARARAADRDGRLSRYVDLDAIERQVAALDGSVRYDRLRAQYAIRFVTMALFIAWFDDRNR